MPKLDRIMTEGIIGEWLKSDGEEVTKGEKIATIETEKAVAEIESPETGTLYKKLPRGSVALVGETIGYILLRGEDLADVAPELQGPKSEETVGSARAVQGSKIEEMAGGRAELHPDKEEIAVSPVARKLARDLSVDLSTVVGTGLDGRITRQDVLSHAETKTTKVATDKEETIPLVGWRKTMAERMAQSKKTAAHITTIAEADVTELVLLRERLRPIEEKFQTRITYTVFIVKAVAEALVEYPIINSSLLDGEIILRRSRNVGLAVAREKAGLIVPVIRDADKKNMVEIAKAIEELTGKARENKLALEDLRDGTFTITNPGILGVIMDTPIINPPESAILGVGAIVKRPTVVDNEIKIRSIMYLCLSYDHRVIDGAPAIQFLQKVRKLLEKPMSAPNDLFNLSLVGVSG